MKWGLDGAEPMTDYGKQSFRESQVQRLRKLHGLFTNYFNECLRVCYIFVVNRQALLALTKETRNEKEL